MAYQTIGKDGRVRTYYHKAYWECMECGHFCGWIDHNVHVEIKRHAHCTNCRKKTNQYSKKKEG